MNTRIKERRAALRAAMAKEGLAACYIPTADYHLSEYVGEHFKFAPKGPIHLQLKNPGADHGV